MAMVQKRLATELPRPHLQDELLIKILLRLPGRSLFLFRSVSKHWLALIQNPNFINLHLYETLINNHTSNYPLLVIPRYQEEEKPNLRMNVLALVSGDDDETLAHRNDVPLESLSPWMNIRGLWKTRGCLLGPCNGLFCITDTIDIMIFNPATKNCREVIRLPSRNAETVFYHHDVTVACFDRVCFGFDSVSRDYKIVGFREEFENYRDDDEYFNFGSLDPSYSNHCRVEIYSLNTDTWSHVNPMAPYRGLDRSSSPNYDLFFNNAFHWLECCPNDIYMIVVFDLNKKAFEVFKLPYNINIDYRDLPVHLCVLNEHFTIVVHKYAEIEIWVMKDYGVYDSWTKLSKISVGWNIIRKQLSFDKDGEVFFKDSNGRLASLNLNTREMKKLEVGVPGGVPMFSFRYRETLVSLERSKN